MKKIIYPFLIIIILIFPQILFAQTSNKELKMVAPSVEKEKSADYVLPYPGLLPDNPLYKAKILRDKFVSFLISDPLKKAEFYLLTADKRLNGALYLFEKDKSKTRLVQSTISKAENYFEKAILKTKEAKRQGADTKDISRRLSASLLKHKETVKNLEEQQSSLKEEFVLLEKRIEDFEKKVESLKPF